MEASHILISCFQSTKWWWSDWHHINPYPVAALTASITITAECSYLGNEQKPWVGWLAIFQEELLFEWDYLTGSSNVTDHCRLQNESVQSNYFLPCATLQESRFCVVQLCQALVSNINVSKVVKKKVIWAKSLNASVLSTPFSSHQFYVLTSKIIRLLLFITAMTLQIPKATSMRAIYKVTQP